MSRPDVDPRELARCTAWLKTRLESRGQGQLRSSAGADPLDFELRVFGQKHHPSASVTKLGVRVRDPSGLLHGLWTEHVGVGADTEAAMRAALDAWTELVLPTLARRCDPADEPDLELAQAVAPHPQRPPAGSRERWGVWLGAPQLRAPASELEALAAQVEAEGLFARLVSQGRLPHFPAQERCHWLELTVAQHGARRIDSCRIDGSNWDAARPALDSFKFSEHAAPMHVHAFALLTRPRA